MFSNERQKGGEPRWEELEKIEGGETNQTIVYEKKSTFKEQGEERKRKRRRNSLWGLERRLSA